jgi:hypothetical protein
MFREQPMEPSAVVEPTVISVKHWGRLFSPWERQGRYRSAGPPHASQHTLPGSHAHGFTHTVVHARSPWSAAVASQGVKHPACSSTVVPDGAGPQPGSAWT